MQICNVNKVKHAWTGGTGSCLVVKNGICLLVSYVMRWDFRWPMKLYRDEEFSTTLLLLLLLLLLVLQPFVWDCVHLYLWMFLLVPAHPGCPGQIPQSRKTVVCVVWDYPGEPVPEETFTHSHLSWSWIILYLLPPLLWSIASSLFNLCAWQSFCTTSVQVLFGLHL